jgi:hypothetical protein
MSVWQDILDMLTTPFVGSLDLEHLFLLVGLVILFTALWIIILGHIQSAAEEI